MKYYLYFPETGIYNGAINLEGNLKDPENATLIEPPEVAEGQVAVFSDGAWSVMEDHRGTYWNTETKEQVDHIMPGPLSENLTSLEPPSRDCKWTGDEWVIDMEKLKADKKAEIADKRWQEETSGYVYNGHTFHSDRQSQDRVFQAYTASLNDPNFTQTWKTKTGWVEMTATDFINLYNEFQTFLQGLYQKEKSLTEQLDSATTPEEVEAIVWET